MPTRRFVTKVQNCSVASRRAGSPDNPAFVFLHGWPQSSRAFVPLMYELKSEYYTIAVDLPGVSGSRGMPATGEKSVLATIVREAIRASEARSVILVGHDVGAMVAFSYLRQFIGELDGAVILNTAIPGLSPWEKIVANPQIWHFGFHSVPDLAETLVLGHQHLYFDFFFDKLSHNPKVISREARDAYASDYASRDALRAGFSWYRAFAADAKRNQIQTLVRTPVLYLRGDNEPGEMNEYLQGLRSSGLAKVSANIIPQCGHFSLDEAPDALARLLRNFRTQCDHETAVQLRVVGEE
jgi:pimeloyl-ACP methyl ester carboxylesterase